MRTRCINCGSRSRKKVLLVQVCSPSEDTDPRDPHADAFEHAHSVAICRDCLKSPVIAATLASTILEKV